MAAERLWRVVVPRKFRLCQRRVDLLVADMVQQHRGPAFPAFELGDQVMKALWHARRNGSATKRANRVRVVLFILAHSSNDGARILRGKVCHGRRANSRGITAGS